ncbi:MAG: ECF transporter S component [Promethearchaeota archaeon]
METEIKFDGTNAEKPLDYKEVVKKDNIENYNGSIWLEKKIFRLVLISTFSALAVVLGYALAYIINIELFTLMIFLGGFILGKKDGLIVGFFSSFIYCFFNPVGPPISLLFFAFQLYHYSLTGFLGGLSSNYFKKKDFFKLDEDLYNLPMMLRFGLIGALITINFQVFSYLIDALLFFLGGNLGGFSSYFLSGIPLLITHIIGNTLGFIFLLPGLIQLIHKILQ